MEEKAIKPLGIKNYGSIGHLPNSRMGPSDHHVHAGQAEICTVKARDKHDEIIVTEKLDGSNCGVAWVGDNIVALGRAGYLAETSKYEQHQMFAKWVYDNRLWFKTLLNPGERCVGEWMAQAHGTRYNLPHEPFVIFDIMRGHERDPWEEVVRRCAHEGFITPRVLHSGSPFSVEQALVALTVSGHGAIDPVEGAVWRVERKGKFDFMAKYVRPDKVDGAYLPEQTGGEAIWNWRPSI